MNYLEMKHVKKKFDSLEVLKDISLSVKEGEVTAIIGPSGSGKSTLLRCATMLEDMDDGELYFLGDQAAKSVDGHSVYQKPDVLKKMRQYYGLVFQNFNLFPHYSVLKNIMDAPIRVQKRKKEEVKEQALGLLKKMGLADKADAYPYQLSGGQQQRVSIARALAMNPKILFFDEPTSALDPELTGEILKVIQELAAEHMTMVIVTHEMEFAREVANHIVFMENGFIVEEGTPDEVFTSQNARVLSFLGKFRLD
jgi:polar amino acid transport system ATP-binding protein